MAIKNLGRVVGKSAYEIWLEQGNTGTEEEFFNSFVPKKGEDYFTEEELATIQDYNNLSNKPIDYLVGTEEAPIYINEFETGSYMISGVIKPHKETAISGNIELAFAQAIKTDTHVHVMCLNVIDNSINHYTAALDGGEFKDNSIDFNTVQYQTNTVVSEETNPSISLYDNTSVQFSKPVESIYIDIPSNIEYGYHAEVIFTNSENSVSVQVNDRDYEAVYFGEDMEDGIPMLQPGKTYHFEFTYDVSGLKCIINRKALLAAGESTRNKVTEINDDNFEEDYPTAGAVKTYVDNKIATDAEKIEDRGIFKVDLKTSYDVIHGTNTGTSISFNITDFTDISEKFTKILKYGLDKAIILLTLNYGLESISMIFTYASYVSSGSNGRTFYFDQNGLSEFEGQLPNRKHRLGIFYNFDSETVSNFNITNISDNKLLLKNNTTSYDVTSDYIPAHKKYVDDAVANIDLTPYATTEEVNEAITNIDLSKYYTKEEVDATIGDIDTILTQIVDSTLDAESKEY